MVKTFMTALVVAGVVLTCAGVAAAQAAPVAGIASTPGQGYWVAGSDGGVFAYGDAGFSGSLGGQSLNQPVIGIAAVPDGKGYWLASGDGGIFAFGSAGFFGSLGGSPLNKPVVGIAAAPDGKGYWLVSSDGGVFAFGSAQFHGSLGDKSLNIPIVAIAAAPDSNGYWLTAADGGVFGFGSARFFGAMATARLNGPVVGIARTSTGGGYWLVAADGGVFTFGDAQFRGSPAPVMPPAPLPAPVPPGARGKVTVLLGGMDPGRPALQSALVDYLERMAGAAGREIVVSTGTRHSRLTTSGRVSDHWSGNAADLGMVANRGTNDGPVGDLLMTVCLTVGGVDPATAASRAQTPGSSPSLRVGRGSNASGRRSRAATTTTTCTSGWRRDEAGAAVTRTGAARSVARCAVHRRSALRHRFADVLGGLSAPAVPGPRVSQAERRSVLRHPHARDQLSVRAQGPSPLPHPQQAVHLRLALHVRRRAEVGRRASDPPLPERPADLLRGSRVATSARRLARAHDRRGGLFVDAVGLAHLVGHVAQRSHADSSSRASGRT
jgi:hypothetical protein